MILHQTAYVYAQIAYNLNVIKQGILTTSFILFVSKDLFITPSKLYIRSYKHILMTYNTPFKPQEGVVIYI